MFKLPAYVAVILAKDNEVLLLKRENTKFASGQWAFPGGCLEENETIMAAVIREAEEEIGVTLLPEFLELIHVRHVRADQTHTRDILGFYFLAKDWLNTPVNKEPHLHSDIRWFTIDNLPENIAANTLKAIEGYKSKIYYSENQPCL